MSSLLRGFSLLLLPLCGWLAGDAVQAKTTLHLAALQRTIALLQRIRQEIQYRRADLQSLYRQLCREGVLAQTHDGTLQQLPAPGQLNQLLIRSGREDQAMMTTLAGLVVVLSILVKQISTLFATIRSLFAL